MIIDFHNPAHTLILCFVVLVLVGISFAGGIATNNDTSTMPFIPLLIMLIATVGMLMSIWQMVAVLL